MNHKYLELSPEVTDQLVERSAYAKINLRIAAILTLCFFMAWLDRTNLSFAQFGMKHDIGLDDAAYGFGVGVFFIGYLILEIPSNLYLSRVGASKTISRIMIVWGIVSMSTMFVQTPTQFYVVRFILGLAEAGFFPGAILIFTYWYPAKRRARVIAFFAFALPIAGLIGGPISGWIMNTFGNFHGLKNWQWLYLLEGLPSVVIGILVYFFFTDNPKQAKWLTDEERNFVTSTLAAEQANKGFSESTHNFVGALKNPRVYFTIFAYFTVQWANNIVNFWGPGIIKNAGAGDYFTTGVLTTIPWLVGSAGMYLICANSDKRLERRWHWSLSALLTAISAVMLAVVKDDLVLTVITLSAMTVGYLSIAALFFTIPCSYLSGTAIAGGLALISSMGQIGGFLSPIVIGHFKQATGSMTTSLLIVAGALILGMLCVIFLIPESSLVEGRQALGGKRK